MTSREILTISIAQETSLPDIGDRDKEIKEQPLG